MTERLYEIVEMPVLGDQRGQLVAIEELNTLPIKFARVYYIYGTEKGVSRGNHAHYKLRQFMTCLAGSCDVMFDNGWQTATETLASPSKCVSVEPLVWHSMTNFSKDCVLLVLAEDLYDEADYIRDYEEFLAIVER